MGQSKGGSSNYNKLPTMTSEQQAFINSLIGPAQGNQAAASEAYKQFLPGGTGNNAITTQANQNFQQTTLPSILNSFGSNAKGSSSLNQALAGGAAQLNTNIAADMSRNALTAAQGIGNLGTAQSAGALTNQFDYQQKEKPLWQQALLAAIGAGGQIYGAR